MTFNPSTSSVDAFLAALEHPHKEGIQQLRVGILNLDPRVTEDVKWNAPSFKLDDHFATFKLHPPQQIQLVLHRGAKKRPLQRPFELSDPHGLVKWAAPDRCVVTLASAQQAIEREAEVLALVRAWMAQL